MQYWLGLREMLNSDVALVCVVVSVPGLAKCLAWC